MVSRWRLFFKWQRLHTWRAISNWRNILKDFSIALIMQWSWNWIMDPNASSTVSDTGCMQRCTQRRCRTDTDGQTHHRRQHMIPWGYETLPRRPGRQHKHKVIRRFILDSHSSALWFPDNWTLLRHLTNPTVTAHPVISMPLNLVGHLLSWLWSNRLNSSLPLHLIHRCGEIPQGRRLNGSGQTSLIPWPLLWSSRERGREITQIVRG